MEAVLIECREFSDQLQLLLFQNRNFLFGDEDFDPESAALDLTTKIHQSLTVALSLLNNTSANNSGDGGTIFSDELVFIRHEISSPVITAGISSFSTYSDDWKNSTDQYSGESKNKTIPGSSSTDRKVGCKRRKSDSHTWVKVTPTPVDDGHAWRKYGQKEIHNTKFPRNYYRCTHKKEQGCEATKQVQKTKDKPSMYQTTYIGNHTCSKLDAASLLLDAIPDPMLDIHYHPTHDDSACVINFQTNLTTKQPYSTTFSSSLFNTSSVVNNKHDQLNIKHNIVASDHDQYYPLKNITESNDHDEFLLLDDLTAFDSISREVLEVLGGAGSNYLSN